MSWNIHAGICPAGRYDLHRVIALVRRHAPDLIALQEVEGRNRHDGEEPFHLLREALGGQAVEAATMREAGGCYGHMLISRLPLRDAAGKLGYVKPEDFDRWVRPEDMIHPGASLSGAGG